MKKGLPQVVFVLLLSQSVFAQGNREYITTKMFWSELVVVGKIKNKFSYQLDYQYRRAADAEDVKGGTPNNPFVHPFQQVLRPWIHYQLNNDIRFSLSPLGWWGTWSESNNNIAFQPEFRICPQITLNQKFGRMVLSHRYRYEFRFLGDKEQAQSGWDLAPDGSYSNFGDNRKGRFRYFLRSIIPFNNNTLSPNTLYLNAFDEVFLGMGGKTKNSNLLDQNRLFIGLGYRFEKEIRVELGYLSQTAFRFNNAGQNNVEQNNILQLFVIVENFNHYFKKKQAKTEEAN